MLPAEQAAPLKLLEKGVSKEALAGLVLLEFPCELASAVLAGRWAASPNPFGPWMLGYKIRLVMAFAVTTLVGLCFLLQPCHVGSTVMPRQVPMWPTTCACISHSAAKGRMLTATKYWFK